MNPSDSDSWLTPELALLIERSAEFSQIKGPGLAFVERAPVESVAVTLGVHPMTVDRARDCMGVPKMRESIVRHFELAAERHRTSPPPPPDPVVAETPRSDLLRDAERHPYGLEFLLRAPIDAVAISFGVHPEEVMAARAKLSRPVAAPEA